MRGPSQVFASNTVWVASVAGTFAGVCIKHSVGGLCCGDLRRCLHQTQCGWPLLRGPSQVFASNTMGGICCGDLRRCSYKHGVGGLCCGDLRRCLHQTQCGWPLLRGPSQVFASNTVWVASVAGTFAGVCIKHSGWPLLWGPSQVFIITQCRWPLLRGPSQVFASNTVWVASVAGTFAGVCIKHSVGGLCCGDLHRCLHQTQCWWPLLRGPSQVFASNTVWVASVAGTFAGVCIKHSVGGLCCGDLCRCLYQTQCWWPLLRGPSQVFASNTVWVDSVAGTFAGVCIKHSVGGLCCGDLRRCLHQTQCGWPLLRGPSQVFASNTVWVASVAGTFAGVCIKHSVGGLCCGDLRRCLHQTQCGWPLLRGPSQVFASNTVGGLCCGDLRRCSYKHSVGGLCCGDLRRCLHQTQCGWPLLRGPSQVFASNTVWVASVAGTFAGVCIKHSGWPLLWGPSQVFI